MGGLFCSGQTRTLAESCQGVTQPVPWRPLRALRKHQGGSAASPKTRVLNIGRRSFKTVHCWRLWHILKRSLTCSQRRPFYGYCCNDARTIRVCACV